MFPFSLSLTLSLKGEGINLHTETMAAILPSPFRERGLERPAVS